MDSDIKKFLAKTIREAVKEEIAQAITTTILPIFVKMLEDSEQRIDKTNTMIVAMSEMMSQHIKCFDKNISQLQKSKEASQENIKTLLASNSELIKQLDIQLQQFNTQHDDYETRIQKMEIRNDTSETRNRALVDKYTNLAEKMTDIQMSTPRQSTSRASNSSVKIDMTR